MPSRTRSSGGGRRRFLKLLAAGSVAALAGSAKAATAPKPAARKRAGAPAARPAALEAEIQNQKRSLAQALAAIRDFPLESGSEPGFGFAPLAPPAHGRTARGTK